MKSTTEEINRNIRMFTYSCDLLFKSRSEKCPISIVHKCTFDSTFNYLKTANDLLFSSDEVIDLVNESIELMVKIQETEQEINQIELGAEFLVFNDVIDSIVQKAKAEKLESVEKCFDKLFLNSVKLSIFNS